MPEHTEARLQCQLDRKGAMTWCLLAFAMECAAASPMALVQDAIKAVLVAWIFIITVCVVVWNVAAYCQRMRMRQVRDPKVPEAPIWIMESPMPTVTKSTPRSSPPVMRKARRARCKRIGGVRTCKRVLFNPRRKNQCGYEALMRACGMAISTKSIQLFRSEVAGYVQVLYERDAMFKMHRVRDIVHMDHESIQSYTRDICGAQWASALELHAGAVLRGVSVSYVAYGEYMILGCGLPSGTIALSKGHYTLRAARRKSRGSKGVKVHENITHMDKLCIWRGGMDRGRTVSETQPYEEGLCSTITLSMSIEVMDST